MNTIIENFKDIITNKYAQFKGRANRAEFWQYVLVYFVISVAFSLLMSLFSGVNALRMIFMILYVIAMLALLVPSLAVSVRRMHDIGKGGGWIFINLIPFIGSIWFLILAIKESEPGANQFEK
ncbi:MAG: DUF805 domain-containing protein [Mariniphaga sp.]|jgi:uncharacterized membrane protein YhaH (DUF805 family)|nr:DUF805 domain-containing protein [Mariniphaga sp.]